MMTPTQQLTRQHNLKGPSAHQSTVGSQPTVLHRIVLVSFVTVMLFALYIFTNTPSASTEDLVETNADSTFSESARSESVRSESVRSESTVLHPEISPRFDLAKVLQPKTSEPPILESISLESISSESISKPLDVEAPLKHEYKPEYKPEQSSESDHSKTRSKTRLTTQLQSEPWITTKVRQGDGLSQIFKRSNVGVRDAYRIIQLEAAKPLLELKPGQEIKIKKGQHGELALLQYQINTFDTLTVQLHDNQPNQLSDNKFVVEIIKREAEIRTNQITATIHQNLLGAAKKSKVSMNTMYNFIALFGWQVDFTMDPRVGDQFSILYEELYLDNEKVGNGDIIAAQLVLSGKVLQAIRHEDEDGFVHHYAPDGGGIQGTFLRTPLKFGHVTSNFSNNRLHPIKKVWRAHTGVDYGAPRGTPVLTTGDGKISLAGRNGGYGKTIVIRHGGKYETVYAHLSGYAKGMRAGVSVKQGEIIGYVGSTGLATGPHLHYEFRINGAHKNPMTVALPRSEPIPEKYRAQFQQTADFWAAKIERLNRVSLSQNSTQNSTQNSVQKLAQNNLSNSANQ